MDFYERIKKICGEHNKVALFVDMDGTLVEYNVFPDGAVTTESRGLFVDNKPLNFIIDKIKRINELKNIDIYILTYSRSNIIREEKKIWLKKYMPFIKESNYIILVKENGDYNSENRNYVKGNKMLEKANEYDYLILLDDDHNILRSTKKALKDRGEVFHVSSTIVE